MNTIAGQKKILEQLDNCSAVDVSLYKKHDIKRGLRNDDGTGVLVGITRVADVEGYDRINGEVVPKDGRLLYRGISLSSIIKDLQDTDRFGFEEVIYLLLLGKLPNTSELATLKEMLHESSAFPSSFKEDVIFKSRSKDVMNMLQMQVLSLYSYDDNPDDTSLINVFFQCLHLVAKFPKLLAYSYYVRRHNYFNESLIIHNCKREYSIAENLLHMMRPDSEFTDQEAKLLDMCLVAHAEHGGGNNSTFATHVVSSTGTDTYSAIATAIGSLKGPKHGGANAKIDSMVDDIKQGCDWQNKKSLGAYLDKILDKGAFDKSGLIYGIGHAVYTKSDPRVCLLKDRARRLASVKGLLPIFELIENIEELGSKKIMDRKGGVVSANVDMYSGFIYHMLGFDKSMYTPLFAAARISGWCAHRIEQIRDSKIMRPAYLVVTEEKDYVSLSDRL